MKKSFARWAVGFEVVHFATSVSRMRSGQHHRVSGWVKMATPMWNDTDLPLGYLITFRCYGTWLHGDKRGSIDRGRMRRDGNWRESHSPWADKGSKRYLWNERSLALAIDYVLNGQGEELPEFD